MVVVDAVDQEVQPAAERAGELPVEQVAVAEILDQRPDQVTARDRGGGRERGDQLERGDGEGQDHRHVDEQRHRPVHAR